jgi:hypothetical protein
MTHLSFDAGIMESQETLLRWIAEELAGQTKVWGLASPLRCARMADFSL